MADLLQRFREALVPHLAFANSFWESYDVLDKPVKAGVRKAMAKFQQSPSPIWVSPSLHTAAKPPAR
ncbi:hypothetical protein [Nonomuraea basaltis]|uniref:hypothetical protein n=1 Tax=Nonomuraea basaltis TaxID=2495887 RepID=UPI00110C54F5|nr:hypothetical protein [Nonomuraea basaltis]TMR96193.1 hypothetical protein EJK15_24420 [Nonomuraea basaltis]